MTDTSTFDISNLKTSGAMESAYSPTPEGDYLAVIDEVEIRMARTVNGDSPVMDVNCKLDDPGNDETDGKHVRYSCWLDLNANGSGYAEGKNKNVKLGALRSAVGQNIPGQEWDHNMLVGQPLRVSVKHDKTGKYANVEAIAAAA